jgi:hypothetical protein
MLVALINEPHGDSYNTINCETHFDRLVANWNKTVLTTEAKEKRLNETFAEALVRHPKANPDRLRSFISYMVYGGFEERELEHCRKVFLHIVKHPSFYDNANSGED